ncbi:MAG: YbgC/FadM family acyl-CoA thioesterase [Sphaerochaetaceae bacterium]
MAHIFPVRVYYSDTDAGGIVYHARYLDFAEHARTELLRSIAQDKEDLSLLSLAFVVKSVTVDYNQPAFLDDYLEVHTTVEQAKRFSLTFLQRVLRQGQEIATIKVKVGSINTESGKIEPIEGWILTAIEASSRR